MHGHLNIKKEKSMVANDQLHLMNFMLMYDEKGLAIFY